MEFVRNIIFVFEIDNSSEPKFSWTAMGEVLKWRMDRLALEMCQQCLGRESRGCGVWPGRVAWQFFVTLLGWLSDPFKWLSDHSSLVPFARDHCST